MRTVTRSPRSVKKTPTPAEQAHEQVSNARRSVLALVRHLDTARASLPEPSPEDAPARERLAVLDAMTGALRYTATLPELPPAAAVRALAFVASENAAAKIEPVEALGGAIERRDATAYGLLNGQVAHLQNRAREAAAFARGQLTYYAAPANNGPAMAVQGIYQAYIAAFDALATPRLGLAPIVAHVPRAITPRRAPRVAPMVALFAFLLFAISGCAHGAQGVTGAGPGSDGGSAGSCATGGAGGSSISSESAGEGGAGGDGGGSSSGSGTTTTTTAPGVCDGSGSCATCAACAADGACLLPYFACVSGPECVDFAACVSECSPAEPPCPEGCAVTYPEGAAEHGAYLACVNEACPVDCSPEPCPNVPASGCSSSPTCDPCPEAPAHGEGVCTSGACSFNCAAGYVKQGGACVCGLACCADADCGAGSTCAGGECQANENACNAADCQAACLFTCAADGKPGVGTCAAGVCACTCL
jgi:hypothetical protein